jgi:hypothetical protein
VRRGAGNIIFQSLGGRARREAFCFWNIFFWGGDAAKLRWREGAQRPVWRNNEPKKTGARSSRARTRGHNPLVRNSSANIGIKSNGTYIVEIVIEELYELSPNLNFTKTTFST